MGLRNTVDIVAIRSVTLIEKFHEKLFAIHGKYYFIMSTFVASLLVQMYTNFHFLGGHYYVKSNPLQHSSTRLAFTYYSIIRMVHIQDGPKSKSLAHLSKPCQ